MHTAQLDPRIGKLISGNFYAFAHGYDKPEVVGTQEEVEKALCIIKVRDGKTIKNFKTFDVAMRFAGFVALQRLPIKASADGFLF